MDELIEVVYTDDNGEIAREKITQEEFDARFETARENFRKKFIEGVEV